VVIAYKPATQNIMTTKYKKISIEQVGEICLKKDIRSRGIRIKINRTGEIIVSMPFGVSEKKALNFVISKADWIIKHQSEIKDRIKSHSPSNGFKTKSHILKITTNKSDKITGKLRGQEIIINIPAPNNIDNPIIQEFIKDMVVKALRLEAKEYLPLRLKQLADKQNLHYKDVRIKRLKSKWGSCSYTNNINLNLHLMQLPDHLIDLVLNHELVHTIEKNHKQGFWDLLENIYPNARILDKELKKYPVNLF